MPNHLASIPTFNVVVKPNKFYCFYIAQQVTKDKIPDFYENFNALDHFHFLDQPIINFSDRIYARIV